MYRGKFVLLVALMLAGVLRAQLPYIPNMGQWEGRFTHHAALSNGGFFAEADAYLLNLLHTDDHAAAMAYFHLHKTFDSAFILRRHAVRIRFAGAQASTPLGLRPGITRRNYFIGDNSQRYASKVPEFHAVVWKNIYQGIDLLLESWMGLPKSTWVVGKGADPGQIVLEYEGVEQLRLDESGRLRIGTSVGEFGESTPFAYQIIKGDTIQVPCRFELNQHQVRFVTGHYNRKYVLYIDPILVFSTYSGSRGDNFGFTATFDAEGNFYSGGIVDNAQGEYPVTTGAYQTIYGGGVGVAPANLACDVAISKYNPDGTQLLYATYIGGNNDEYPHSLVADHSGNLLIMGTTASNDFPAKDGFDTTFNGGGFDIFVFKLNPDGSQRLGATYFGGSGRDGLVAGALRHNYADDFRGDIYVDDSNRVYLATCTQSGNIPITPGAFQPNSGGGLDAVLLSFDSTLHELRWSTYYGRNGADAAYSVKIDSKGQLWAAGGATSNSLTMVDTGYQRSFGGGTADGWIACLNPADGSFKKTSYFGTADYDQVYFIDLDVDDRVYAMGQTRGAMQRTPGTYGQNDMGQFICRFNNRLDSLEFLTTFGSRTRTAQLCPSAFMVDYCYNIYVSGWGSNIAPNTQSTTSGLVVTPDAVQPTTDGSDFYLYVLGKDANTLLYATFFGGDESEDHVDGGTSRFDKSGVIYQSVCASCPDRPPGLNDFPTTPGVVFPNNVSYRCSNASFKLDFNITYAVRADFDFNPKTGCAPKIIQFTNKSLNAKRFLWHFGDGQTSTTKDPVHRYVKAGTYRIVLYSLDSFSCNVRDSMVKFITLLDGPEAEVRINSEPCSQEVVLQAVGKDVQRPVWYFEEGDSVEGLRVVRTFPRGLWDVMFVSRGSTGNCIDTVMVQIDMKADSTGSISVPNVFTPNMDGINDCYRFDGISNECDEIELFIYNRWGQLVFSTKKPSDCWNGKLFNTGDDLPEGVYFYLFKRRRLDGLGEKGHGTIELIR
jgi:gliding motility-associated-like protein